MPTPIDRTRRGWPWQVGANGEVLKVVDGWPTWDAASGGGGGGGVSVGAALPYVAPIRRSGIRRTLFDDFTAAMTGTNVSADTYIFTPFTVWREVSVTSFGIFVTSSSTGAVRIGIYNNAFSGGNDQPGARLVQTADIDTSGTSNTYRTAAASITLSPGVLYWAAMVKRGSASIHNRTTAYAVLGRSTDINSTAFVALIASATGWTELPATAPATTAQTSVNFRIAVYYEE